MPYTRIPLRQFDHRLSANTNVTLGYVVVTKNFHITFCLMKIRNSGVWNESAKMVTKAYTRVL